MHQQLVVRSRYLVCSVFLFQLEADMYYYLAATTWECFGFLFEMVAGEEIPIDFPNLTCSEAFEKYAEVFPYSDCAGYEYYQNWSPEKQAYCEELGHWPESKALASLKEDVSEVRELNPSETFHQRKEN